MSCAGCPTKVGADKLAERVRGLTEFGVEAIHFSICMVALCPFKGKYEKMLNETYPQIEIVMGTHQAPPNVTEEDFVMGIKELLGQRRMMIPDLAKRMEEEMAGE